ncbi:hypothetical protein NDU88_006110 [Pleurodeles waltl]|uniref:Uncharacterized protein n=1 Tax=Pleurodeles waltl TaxID=8319 RepID=A0AAV7NQV4_PLEWA|nr:hypothetical protein NDU88_006110 [Pleurodeles waltl]
MGTPGRSRFHLSHRPGSKSRRSPGGGAKGPPAPPTPSATLSQGPGVVVRWAEVSSSRQTQDPRILLTSSPLCSCSLLSMRAWLKRPAVRAQSRQMDPRGGRPWPAAIVRAGRLRAPQNQLHPLVEWWCAARLLRGPGGHRSPGSGPGGSRTPLPARPGRELTPRDAGWLPPRKSLPSLFSFRMAPLPDGAQAIRISGTWSTGLWGPRATPQPGRPRSHPGPTALVLQATARLVAPQERRKGAMPPGAAPSVLAVPRRLFGSLRHDARCWAAPAMGAF